MRIDLLGFLAIMATALALVPGGAHLLEAAAKLRLGHDDYLTTQQLYRGWTLSGLVIFLALGLNLAQAWRLRRRGAPFLLSLAAGGLILVSLGLFFALTFPVNQATQNWTTGGGDWQGLRRQWEYSHIANAVITFAALCCAALSATSRR